MPEQGKALHSGYGFPHKRSVRCALSGEFTARAVGRPECDAAMPVSKKGGIMTDGNDPTDKHRCIHLMVLP